MKKVLLCVFMLSVFGQGLILCQDIARDTLQIEQVNVVKNRKEYLSEGAQKESLNKRQLAQFSFRTLGEVLQYSTSINVKSYGSPGASSSVSLRGLGASHTQVNWNGFPVNSVTLGSSDISNIPILSNQSVSILPGASGVNYGSGTFGGALNIDYNPGNELTTNIGSATVSYGSMNTIKGAAIYQVQHLKWSFSGSLWGDQSDGDFEYFDEIKQETYNRENADYHQKGFQQYFSFNNSKYSELKGGIWGQIKDLNIPNIEGSSLENFENQKDSTLRMFLHWKKVMHTSALNLKTAWFYTDQHYTDKESEDAESLLIDSRIKSKKWMVDASYRVYLFEKLTFDGAFDYSYTSADVAAYNGNKYDYSLAIVTGLKYVVNKLKVNGSLRKDWGKRSNSAILLSLGASYTLKEESWFLRSAYSQKFRRPTFNDMYWDPGGDPDLKQEKGWSYELGNVYVFKTDEVGEFKLDISTYYGYINNMIVWRPEGSTWYAKNYEDVLTRGVDVKLDYTKPIQELNVHASYALSYNKATIEDTMDDSVEPGQSLYYAPEWISSLNINMDWHQFYLDVNWRFVTERTYDDNGGKLDPYSLVSADLARELLMGKQKITCSLGIDNAFAEQYQMVRSYPMPGRLYHFKLKYKF